MSDELQTAREAGRGRLAGGMVRLGEAARLSGVTVQQLSYYLMLGVVRPADVSEGKQRLFDHAAIRRIKLIALLNKSGYPLSEIREIFMDGRGGGFAA